MLSIMVRLFLVELGLIIIKDVRDGWGSNLVTIWSSELEQWAIVLICHPTFPLLGYLAIPLYRHPISLLSHHPVILSSLPLPPSCYPFIPPYQCIAIPAIIAISPFRHPTIPPPSHPAIPPSHHPAIHNPAFPAIFVISPSPPSRNPAIPPSRNDSCYTWQ